MSSNEWREVKLGETATIKGGKRLPKGKSLSKLKNSHPYIRVRDIGNSRLLNINDNFEYVDDDTQKTISRYIVNTNDILISIVGTIGLIAKVGETLNNANLTENCAKIINLKEVDSDYLYYFLISEKGQAEIKKATVGAVQAKLPLKNIQSIKMSLPALLEQRTIAATLSCLDDMIELNNRTNKILEEMAQAIFKRWFVDFEFPNEDGEPYKSSGGEMVDSQLGEIPRGWRIGRFNDLIEKTISGDWGKEDKKGNYTQKVLCIRGADIPEIEKGNKGNAPYRFILPKNFETKELSANEMIVEISGGSPTQSTGRCALISNELIDAYDVPMVCTNFCRAVRFKTTNYSHFGYRYWKYLYNQDVFFQYENGTTGIKNLDLTGILDKELINLPSIELLVDFKKMSEVCIKSICQNASESSNLSKIRDNLLPKLMSGEIRVPIEEVV